MSEAEEVAGSGTEAGQDDTENTTEEAVEASAAPEADDSASEPSETLAEAQARADENWDKYLRTAAELDNTLRRASRDVQNARKFALERFAAEIVNVRDSLEMGVAAAKAEDAEVEQLREGSELTLKLLSRTLEKFGIKEIDPEGEAFDPEFHEAMSMQVSESAKPDTVLQVIQKGYTLNDRLLRPARVIVARAS